MSRRCNDWLHEFCEYSSFGEAPRRMYFWTGVSAIAGALRRRVWIDQAYFKWFANQYIILVAPPGIVSKSTTADTAMSLLREVPNIRFGPSVVTWQALVQGFAAAAEQFEHGGEFHSMSPMTIVSSEFGNLLNPQDKEMVDMLVNLWDGKGFTKMTKGSGNDTVVNPWINVIACTTPEWIAGSFPEYMIGGGFTSRCLFVYAGEKEKYIAYPGEQVPKNLAEKANDLIHDLDHISTTICGEYKIDNAALAWGTEWYKRHYAVDSKSMDSSRFGGYIARKQTHIHKLAMVLAAAQRDELVITVEDLQVAYKMVTDLEPEMSRVFEKIGQKQESVQVERLVRWVRSRGRVLYRDVFRFMQAHFPHKKELEDVLHTCISAGHFKLVVQGEEHWIVAVDD